MSAGHLRNASISGPLTDILPHNNGDSANNNKEDKSATNSDVERPKIEEPPPPVVLPKETTVIVSDNEGARNNNKNGQVVVRTEIYSPDSQASEKFPGKKVPLFSIPLAFLWTVKENLRCSFSQT